MEKAFQNLFEKLGPQTPGLVFYRKQIPPSILPDLAKFQGLKKLSLIDCNLRSLEGLPRLPDLRILMLGDNNLDDLSPIPNCFPNLEKLSVVGNRIRLRDQLQPLTRLNKLRALDVEGNDICEIRGHDRWLKDTFPQVTHFIIVAYDVDGDEEDDGNATRILCNEHLDDDDEAFDDDQMDNLEVIMVMPIDLLESI
ncbi:acidic leucine-rich nuclear phosphoprotein 32 family member A-like isoform X2 [Paramacrobiotus metropolitanus]|nr:acidic leucine-rich nuclear phosphoprotein 32 family member A-like isoform X2 [Paramacrobiotus metropolitanus]XP_055344975.1 acidic leucine-rich nuclear phosphoprotein 32 family member A-like isoform X2 [Paramacrobiotus metropolitanus]XP_055344976.1 acidic leucine-rich nuclear phosphoprotein 32 family member A-like isoform X2 [Paramacrobiotus metropolitanus]